MRYVTLMCALACALVGGVALADGYRPWRQPTGEELSGVVMNCGLSDRTAVPCGGPDSPLMVSALPTADAGRIAQTIVALPANASTRLVAANPARAAIEVQCDGTAVVGLDMTGSTLTSAAGAPRVIPAGAYPLYTPPVTTLAAITAFTGTAQVCRVTEYLR